MARVFAQLMVMGSVFASVMACETEEPCDRYVEYMCECHDGGEVSCEELSATYIGADAAVQDECAIALAEQEDEDDANPAFDCYGTADGTDPSETTQSE